MIELMISMLFAFTMRLRDNNLKPRILGFARALLHATEGNTKP
ncbi:hypothetical protein [Glutamicibacter sp. HZAU]|nr:hypothetical protein [Glutamicibacter sp. HZAU]